MWDGHIHMGGLGDSFKFQAYTDKLQQPLSFPKVAGSYDHSPEKSSGSARKAYFRRKWLFMITVPLEIKGTDHFHRQRTKLAKCSKWWKERSSLVMELRKCMLDKSYRWTLVSCRTITILKILKRLRQQILWTWGACIKNGSKKRTEEKIKTHSDLINFKDY